MAKYSKQPPKKAAGRVPSFTRGSYQKSLVAVPVPPEVQKFQRNTGTAPTERRITQERAREITGKSEHTVRRWANGRQAIDTTSLRLLQVWVWGIIPGQEFIEAGIFLAYDSYRYVTPTKGQKPETLIATDNGYFITAADLQSFGWLQKYYRDAIRRADEDKARAEEAAKPSAAIIPFAEYLAKRNPPESDKEKA